jgi:DNA-binding MarR family transcriptional regulator/GNAT superfamily N-acetyltransferase
MASIAAGPDIIDRIRAFNRLYTQKIGLLHETHLGSDFSLTQVRLLYELANRKHPTAAELSRDLGLDAGYISRTLAVFQRHGFIERRKSASDARQVLLALTRKGLRAFQPLNDRARDDIRNMLESVPASSRTQLIAAIGTIHDILAPQSTEKPPYLIRTHQPGDIGWVIQRHGALYAKEYGWDNRFEALVAHIAAGFIDNFDEKRERCWIAEIDGRNVGSVFLVKKTQTIAKLRLLLVEPDARGLGIGRRLVAECIRFARERGYRKITLWTQSNLTAARKIYQGAGFRLIRKEPHNQFGRRLTSETWDLKL